MSTYGADLLGVSEETFAVLKASAQSGWLSGLGVQGVNLQGLISLVPVETPFVNKTPRVKPSQGSNFAYWRQLVNINNQQSNPATGNDFAGPLTLFEEQDVFSPFVPLRETGRVTQDSIDIAGGYADALAIATMQVINQLRIGEDIHGIGSQAYALPAIGTPTFPAASQLTTGGTVAASTAVYVTVAARAGWNYYYGGNGPVSAAGHTTTASTTSTNTVVASVVAVRGAVAYDWFVGTSSAQYYYTTTTVNSVSITAVPTAAQAVPTTGFPLLSTTVPTASTADGSFSANNYNGLLASALGDYGAQSAAGGSLVTPGSGVNNQGYFASADGASLAFSNGGIAALDAMNQAIWDTALVSPSRYLMNSHQAANIGSQLLGSTAATTYIQAGDIAERQHLIAGGAFGTYLNKAAGGAPISIEVQTHLPPGTVIAVTDRIPYPGANIDAPYRFEVQRDYSQTAYGANVVLNTAGGGPRQDFDVSVRETFMLLAPPTVGVLANCV